MMLFLRLPPQFDFNAITIKDIEVGLDYEWKSSTKELIK